MNPYETPHAEMEDPRSRLVRRLSLGRFLCGGLAWGGLIFSLLAFLFCILSNQDPARLTAVESAGWWALGVSLTVSAVVCLWSLGNAIVDKWKLHL